MDARNARKPTQLGLVDAAAADSSDERLRRFARATAKRHRTTGGTLEDFDRALCGYHATLRAIARPPIPALESREIELARRARLAAARPRTVRKAA